MTIIQKSDWQFWLIIGVHLVFVALAVITGIFFLFPEKLVDGTYLTLILTIATSIVTRLESRRLLSFSMFSSILLHLDRYLSRYLIWTIALVLGCIFWVAIMFDTFIDRFKYVDIVRNAMQPSTLEVISLPDPARLADAFFLYPNRREAAFLLARASRIFHHGNQTNQFSRYQDRFIGRLDELGLEQLKRRILVGLERGQRDLNGLHFYARVNAEARGNPKSYDSSDATKKAIQGIEQSIAWLELAPQVKLSSGERVIDYEARILNLTLDYWMAYIQKTGLESIWRETEAMSRELSELSPEALANLYQSHIFQEFLDLKAFLVSDSVKNDSAYASSPANITEALENYRRILMLRTALSHSGQVQWIVAPTKLTLFHLFMVTGGAKTTVSDQQDDTVTKNKEFRARLDKLVLSKAFESFQHPDAWYKGTPMDPELNGDALKYKIEQWLRTGW